ncbi:uncharacterized protein LOC106014179 [Aplysia californica]|uniref:Uncharacterized protein LOC106014179 n=1 Tax=Aplysia californica TaxID=6500 RepID=A0ABM1AFN8_APLCA|nr:uncharacterized protein LOC106014179 [Aplysia californica]
MPVGEIQIEVYESIPRHRNARKYSSDPNLVHSSPQHQNHRQGPPENGAGRDSPRHWPPKGDGYYLCSGHETPTGEEDPDAKPLHFSDISLSHLYPHSDITTKEDDVIASEDDPETCSGKDDQSRHQKQHRSWQQAGRSLKKQLTRQTRIDATTEDPDLIEVLPDDASPSTSGYSSPSGGASSSFSSSPNTNNSRKGRPTSARRKRQLSAVEEQHGGAETETVDKQDFGFTSGSHSRDTEDSNPADDKQGCEQGKVNDLKQIRSSEEKLHFVALSGGKVGKYDELFPDQAENFTSESERPDAISVTNESNQISISSKDIATLPRSKALYSLDKIAMLPSYNDLNCNPSVYSVDFINNNFDTVPDRMLPHNNSPLSSVLHYKSPTNGFLRHEPSLEKEGVLVCDEKSIKAMYTISGTGSLDSQQRTAHKLMPFACECGGKPTLKCACGRDALEKLLRQKNLLRDNIDDNQGPACQLSPSKISNKSSENSKNGTIQSINDLNLRKSGIHLSDSNNSAFDNAEFKKANGTLDENDEEVYGYGNNGLNSTINEEEDFQGGRHPKNDDSLHPREPPRSILVGNAPQKRHISNIECRMVTFSKDTIFNEGKHTKYIKECISPTDLLIRASDFSDQDDSTYDNPVFDEDDDGIYGDDELGEDYDLDENGEPSVSKPKRKFSFKHPVSRNKISANDSVLLKVSELNVPSYMEKYLTNGQGCDIIRSPVHSARSPNGPVSLDAIGGITVADPSFDVIGEADEEDFEYYRRRRQKKYGSDGDVQEWLRKLNRPRKIKICVIIVVIIAVVITGIALAIYYGTPSGTGESSSLVGSESVASGPGGFGPIMI